MDIKQKAYHKYQLDWMLSHGRSLDDLMDCMQGWWDDDETREFFSPKVAFADFEKAGFDGEIWVCFDEFLEEKYQDQVYMKGLLSTDEYQEYLKDRGLFTVISSFRDDFDFLSNFYPAPFSYGGIRFMNAESAFQAQKDPRRVREFTDLNPSEAKKLRRKVHLRKDWENVKISVMHDIVNAKFMQNPDLIKKLLSTGEAMLIEENTWHDNIWGSCTCDRCKNQGQNILGRILMSVRDTCRTLEYVEK